MLRKEVDGGLVGLAAVRRFSHNDSVIIRRDLDNLGFARLGFDDHRDPSRHHKSMTQRTPAIKDI